VDVRDKGDQRGQVEGRRKSTTIDKIEKDSSHSDFAMQFKEKHRKEMNEVAAKSNIAPAHLESSASKKMRKRAAHKNAAKTSKLMHKILSGHGTTEMQQLGVGLGIGLGLANGLKEAHDEVKRARDSGDSDSVQQVAHHKMVNSQSDNADDTEHISLEKEDVDIIKINDTPIKSGHNDMLTKGKENRDQYNDKKKLSREEFLHREYLKHGMETEDLDHHFSQLDYPSSAQINGNATIFYIIIPAIALSLIGTVVALCFCNKTDEEQLARAKEKLRQVRYRIIAKKLATRGGLDGLDEGVTNIKSRIQPGLSPKQHNKEPRANVENDELRNMRKGQALVGGDQRK